MPGSLADEVQDRGKAAMYTAVHLMMQLVEGGPPPFNCRTVAIFQPHETWVVNSAAAPGM